MVSNQSPILVLEDDLDDQEILESVFVALNTDNPRRYFSITVDFLEHLKNMTEQPMLIFSDINVSITTGIEIKEKIESSLYLKTKTIPFVFLTTSSRLADVLAAYELHTQGFFVKPDNFDEFTILIRDVLSYWTHSRHPNNL